MHPLLVASCTCCVQSRLFLSLYIGFRWLATRLEAIAATRSAVSIYYSDRSLRNVATGWINASKPSPPPSFPRLTEQSRLSDFLASKRVPGGSRARLLGGLRSRCSRIGRGKDGGFFFFPIARIGGNFWKGRNGEGGIFWPFEKCFGVKKKGADIKNPEWFPRKNTGRAHNAGFKVNFGPIVTFYEPSSLR